MAVPIWVDRVSPVFDVAKRLLLVELLEGRVSSTMEHDVSDGDRVRAVTELGVNLLICGAVSLQLERRLVSAGVEVIPEICGSVDEVIQAYLTGSLSEERFNMPGCSRQRRRRDMGRQDDRAAYHEEALAEIEKRLGEGEDLVEEES